MLYHRPLLITCFRYTHRFVPISSTCYTSIADIQSLVRKVMTDYLSQHPSEASTTVSMSISRKDLYNLTLLQYKIELRVRNHTSLTRPSVIQAIAECIPQNFKVELTNPEVFILVEIFKVGFLFANMNRCRTS